MAANFHTKAAMRPRQPRKRPVGGKWQLADFDTLQREKKSESGSIWKGDRGLYIIRHLEKQGEHLPVAKVILNNEFLTGLFKTKNTAIFSGDTKQEGRKRFLLFKVLDAQNMKVQISDLVLDSNK